jgi:hypothetical protein
MCPPHHDCGLVSHATTADDLRIDNFEPFITMTGSVSEIVPSRSYGRFVWLKIGIVAQTKRQEPPLDSLLS